MRYLALCLMLLAAGLGGPRDVMAQPAPAPAPTGQPANMPAWASLPAMVLERSYRGPLRDTVLQRWRDPSDGTVCFLYIPISTPIIVPTPAESPYIQYGPNTIGSISCVARPVAAAAPVRAAQPSGQAAPGARAAAPRPAAR